MSESPVINLRPATAADRPFLQRVYAESRADELAATGWTDAQKDTFCREQFHAQDQHYRQHYPQCEYLVIQAGERPIGRLYLDRRPDEIRVVDVALLSKSRGQGIGGKIMQDIILEGNHARLPVRIHVERQNPARRLYDRLGFCLAAEGDVYDLLEYPPDDTLKK